MEEALPNNINKMAKILRLNSNGIEDLIVSNNIHELHNWNTTKSFDGSEMMHLDELPIHKEYYVRLFVLHTVCEDFPHEVVFVRKDIVNEVLNEYCNFEDIKRVEAAWDETDHRGDEFDFFHEVFEKPFDVLCDYVTMETGFNCLATGRYLTFYINAQDYMRNFARHI